MAFDQREYMREYNKRNRVRLLEQQRTRRNRNREQWLTSQREYYQANRERIRETQRKYAEIHREERLEYNKTTRHGITRVIRNWMYESQNGACAGCFTPMPDSALDIDHDHDCCPGTLSCGRCVRGLVCRSCNIRDALATKVG